MSDQITELVEETQERYEQAQEQKREFLETVSDESEAEVIETTCPIVGDMTVNISVKYNGDLMDRMGHIEEKLEYVDEQEKKTYKISEAADDASQLLADIVEDSGLDKDAFYTAYKTEGLDELGKMLENIMEAIEREVERQQGTADGFRQ